MNVSPEVRARYRSSAKGKETARAYAKKWRDEQRAEYLAWDREYRRKHRERIREASKRRYSEHGPYPWERNSRLRYMYGISVAEFDAMLKRQDGRCAMPDCRTKIPGGKGHFHVDHDHDSKRVRGLLCHK